MSPSCPSARENDFASSLIDRPRKCSLTACTTIVSTFQFRMAMHSCVYPPKAPRARLSATSFVKSAREPSVSSTDTPCSRQRTY